MAVWALGSCEQLVVKEGHSPICAFSEIVLGWCGGWAGGEGLAKTYEEAINDSHSSSPSFIDPAPSLQATLSSCSGLGGRHCSEGPGHEVLAGCRALRENLQEPAGWRG